MEEIYKKSLELIKIRCTQLGDEAGRQMKRALGNLMEPLPSYNFNKDATVAGLIELSNMIHNEMKSQSTKTIIVNPTPDWRIGKRFTYKSKYGPSMFVGEIKEVIKRDELIDDTYIRSTTGQTYKLYEVTIQS